MSTRELKKLLRIALIFIFIIGIFFRLAPAIFVGTTFPFRYGGLFLEFAQQIHENHYSLPVSIPYYTENGIPFAYPPLPFYIESLLIYDLGIPQFIVVNFLPSVMSILSILLFALLVKQLRFGKITSIFSIIAFALIPNSYSQTIEGGGLAEAFGCFFIILLAITAIYSAKKGVFWRIILLAISWALCIVASPGSAYASVLLMLLFFIWGYRSEKESISHLVIEFSITLMITIILTSPYWFTVVRNHGFGVFWNSFIAQHSSLSTFGQDLISRLFMFQWASNTFWDSLIFIGFIYSLLRRKWFFIAWFFIFIFIPREGDWLTAIPASLLAGMGAYNGLKFIYTHTPRGIRKFRSKIIVLLISEIILLVNVFYPPISLTEQYVSEQSQGLTSSFVEMATWVKNNLPANANLVFLSTTQVIEWSPLMTQRTVLNVPYGTEWKPDEALKINALNGCIDACDTKSCVSQCIAEKTGHSTFFVIIQSYFWQKYGVTDANSKWDNQEYKVFYSQ
jgi:hypothetical protein